MTAADPKATFAQVGGRREESGASGAAAAGLRLFAQVGIARVGADEARGPGPGRSCELRRADRSAQS